MHGYDHFFIDVEKAFSSLINRYHAIVSKKEDKDFGQYAVEITFSCSKLVLDLDRKDLQCKLVNLANSQEFQVIQILNLLHPEKEFVHKVNKEGESRQAVVSSLNFFSDSIEKYLINAINGDFGWSEKYYQKEKEDTMLVKEVLKLDYGDEIQQKFWKGDLSWKNDMRLRLKKALNK